MINQIIASISIALDAEFGYENHMEEIKQGLEAPCFFITCLNPTTNLFLGKRYFRQNQFCIQYFPKSTDNQQAECNDVAERLVWCLQSIEAVGQNILGTKMNYEVIDGVLNFFINFDCYIYLTVESTPMETMDSTTNVKEGDE